MKEEIIGKDVNVDRKVFLDKLLANMPQNINKKKKTNVTAVPVHKKNKKNKINKKNHKVKIKAAAGASQAVTSASLLLAATSTSISQEAGSASLSFAAFPFTVFLVVLSLPASAYTMTPEQVEIAGLKAQLADLTARKTDYVASAVSASAQGVNVVDSTIQCEDGSSKRGASGGDERVVTSAGARGSMPDDGVNCVVFTGQSYVQKSHIDMQSSGG